MRAEQAIMVAVGLLGGFAVYRMLKAPKGPQTLAVEEKDTFVVPQDAGLALQGDPLTLRQGSRYRIRLHLQSNLAPFGTGSSSEEIQKGFESMGMGNVIVQTSPPSGWPAASLGSISPNVRWVEGTWMSPSMSLPRPKEIAMMWQTRNVP